MIKCTYNKITLETVKCDRIRYVTSHNENNNVDAYVMCMLCTNPTLLVIF